MLESMGQQFFKSRALPLVAICIIAVATLAGGYFGSPRVVRKTFAGFRSR